jgi:hypothetical protein
MLHYNNVTPPSGGGYIIQQITCNWQMLTLRTCSSHPTLRPQTGPELLYVRHALVSMFFLLGDTYGHFVPWMLVWCLHACSLYSIQYWRPEMWAQLSSHTLWKTWGNVLFKNIFYQKYFWLKLSIRNRIGRFFFTGKMFECAVLCSFFCPNEPGTELKFNPIAIESLATRALTSWIE